MRFRDFLIIVAIVLLGMLVFRNAEAGPLLNLIRSGDCNTYHSCPTVETVDANEVEAREAGCFIDRSQNFDVPPTLTPPPVFINPDPPAPDVPEVVVTEPEEKDMDIGNIILLALSAGVGWYFGKNYADEDGEDDSLIDGAQRRLLERLVPTIPPKE